MTSAAGFDGSNAAAGTEGASSVIIVCGPRSRRREAIYLDSPDPGPEPLRCAALLPPAARRLEQTAWTGVTGGWRLGTEDPASRYSRCMPTPAHGSAWLLTEAGPLPFSDTAELPQAASQPAGQNRDRGFGRDRSNRNASKGRKHDGTTSSGNHDNRHQKRRRRKTPKNPNSLTFQQRLHIFRPLLFLAMAGILSNWTASRILTRMFLGDENMYRQQQQVRMNADALDGEQGNPAPQRQDAPLDMITSDQIPSPEARRSRTASRARGRPYGDNEALPELPKETFECHLHGRRVGRGGGDTRRRDFPAEDGAPPVQRDVAAVQGARLAGECRQVQSASVQREPRPALRPRGPVLLHGRAEGDSQDRLLRHGSRQALARPDELPVAGARVQVEEQLDRDRQGPGRWSEEMRQEPDPWQAVEPKGALPGSESPARNDPDGTRKHREVGEPETARAAAGRQRENSRFDRQALSTLSDDSEVQESGPAPRTGGVHWREENTAQVHRELSAREWNPTKGDPRVCLLYGVLREETEGPNILRIRERRLPG
ncbi:hypothetical protein THAOC_27597 [Thalassiosira oceanica]|uniref:Uncharacterized protein n=1 Tax=Thalassiosira oceanica TaxID=159749 RepID=K0RIH1_THAOC|nr:hypothetical protein THAOC_27597 [Thalassiosira oceanica]|eukprot:EJK53035.1 hypothetical protein THAOC_27597 [Thalassiosira oceanica]